MSLNSPDITEVTTESAPLKVLNEWLALWFDGNPHAVGNQTVTFPKVNRAFNQGSPEQPLHTFAGDSDAEIRVVMVPRFEMAEHADTSLFTGKLVTDFVLFQFWVSAKRPGKGQSQFDAERIAQLLKAILANPDARYPLAEKGITHLNPSAPQAVTDKDYARRLVGCTAQLQYPVQFGDNIVTPPGPGEMMAQFLTEAVLLQGDYLVGMAEWNADMLLESATVIAWAPQDQPVVLGLDFAGTLTGDQLVIPVGDPNTDVTAALALSRTLPANVPMRWKVLSAPDPELTAWHCSVTVKLKQA